MSLNHEISYDEAMSSNDQIPVVYTHDGIFHCDEVLAIAILRLSGDQSQVIRTRDLIQVAENDILVDVGGEYNPSLEKFDHHQRGGAGTRDNGVPYASAGLVWKAYGQRVVARWNPSLTDDQRALVVQMVDDQLVAGVDARDCGWVDNNKPVYQDPAQAMTVSAIVASMNPTWVEDLNVEEMFNMAVRGVMMVLSRTIATAVAVVMARTVVEEAIASSTEGIMEVPTGTPWAAHLQDLDPNHEQVKLVIYQDLKWSWRLQSPNVRLGSFELVTPMPEPWRGLRRLDLDREIQKILPDWQEGEAIFVHPNGFIAGANTRDGVLGMARVILTLEEWSKV